MIKLSRKCESLLQELKEYNPETYFHSLRVKTITAQMLKAMSAGGEMPYTQEQVDSILTGAILHDVGKADVKNFVLTKKERLTKNEYDEIKAHTQSGTEKIAGEFEGEAQNIVGDICLDHHERIDGNGYYGKETLPLYVQIVALCDVYDALVSDRVYREGMSPEKAVRWISEEKCGYFSEKLVSWLAKAVIKE